MYCRSSIVKVVFQLFTLQDLPDSGVMAKDSVTSCQFDRLKEESLLAAGSLLLGPWSMNSFELAIYINSGEYVCKEAHIVVVNQDLAPQC